MNEAMDGRKRREQKSLNFLDIGKEKRESDIIFFAEQPISIVSQSFNE